MNEKEEYIINVIKNWVWSGFYTQSDIREMIYDILEKDCDEKIIFASVGPEMQKKINAEKDWPKITDYDKLHQVFYELHEHGICALHNAGYTMSDGYSDVSEVVAGAPEGHYHGYCFYHGQDLERALDGGGLMIAFGDLNDDEVKGLNVGNTVVEKLNEAGFNIEWDRTLDSRINIPTFNWQKRNEA